MIEEYSPDWPVKYGNEASLIKETLGTDLTNIEHIGSTSVPNLFAKPIIDIAVLSQSISNPDIFIEPLRKIGYEYKPEMSSEERLFFRKGDPVQYHLSISEPRFSYWNRQILFRNYLRAHQEVAKEYENLKLEIVKNLPEIDLQDLSLSKEYNSRKTSFIENVLKVT